MERASIILNPVARNAPSRSRLLNAADRVFRDTDWEIDLKLTRASGHAQELARESVAQGASAVFACGGDGTVNEVVNGLAGTDVSLGLIRGGTGNVFAKEIGVPRRPEAALRVLLEGDRARFDLGMADERYFLIMAGVGIDAAVVSSVPRGPKKVLGTSAYVLWAFSRLLRYRIPQASIVVEGEARETDLFWLLLGNTRSYGGVLNVTKDALADDGALDVFLFGGHKRRWIAATAWKLAVGRHVGANGVEYHRLDSLDVLTPGLPVQADGEYFGETPMRFGVAPQALSVLLPPGKGRQLLSRTPESISPP